MCTGDTTISLKLCVVCQRSHTKVWYGLFGLSLFVYHCIMYTKLIHYVYTYVCTVYYVYNTSLNHAYLHRPVKLAPCTVPVVA